jgi:nucleoid-associated protein YgaU
MRDEEYFRFRVEKDNPDWFSIVVKSLSILALIIFIIFLSIWGYRYVIKNESVNTQNQKKILPNTQNTQKIVPKEATSPKLKKEELALIIKLVLEEIGKNQKNQVVAEDIKKSEDSELLKSLQNSQVDTTKEMVEMPKITEEKRLEELANKKIKDEVIKKKITYNAVVINHKEVRSVDDLAKLYASINKISKKKKKKILKSAYTKKITKEIIIRKNAMRTITVKAGDTLSSIALRAYGKSSMYKKIFEANPDLLSNPNNLKVGMRLRVPK